jgi:hypothetical protein
VTHEHNLDPAEDKVILSFKICTPILLPSRKARRILCSVISISPEKWFWVAVGSYEEEAMMVQKLGVRREANTGRTRETSDAYGHITLDMSEDILQNNRVHRLRPLRTSFDGPSKRASSHSLSARTSFNPTPQQAAVCCNIMKQNLRVPVIGFDFGKT